MITQLGTTRVVATMMLALCTFLMTTGQAAAQSAEASASLDGAKGQASGASGTTVSVKFEPGVAFPLSSPQSDEFGIGGGGHAKLGIGVMPLLDLQASAGFIGFSGKPTRFTKGQLVSVTMLAAGARLQKPHAGGGLSPWVDLDLGFIQTGDLSRFGYAVGGGVQFPLNDANSTWLGPFVRFVQIASGEKPNINSDDARILLAGLTLEFEVVGEGAKDTDKDGVPDSEDKCPTKPGRKEWQGCPDSDGDGIPDHEDKCPEDPGPESTQGCPAGGDADRDGVPDKEDRCPKVRGPKENKGCPDSDGDSINDADDQCPNVKGEPDNKGCPRYKQVVVKDSKIELSQKIFFAFNQATILPKSFDILDEVAQALKDAPALRVRIEGHTDATGSVEHNLALSEARASAVREYLIGQGITPERLESKGYGPTLPLESNATAEGRERNRRVEFVILNK